MYSSLVRRQKLPTAAVLVFFTENINEKKKPENKIYANSPHLNYTI